MNMCRSQDQISVRLSPATSDETLVAVAKLGDRSAFAELWNRHSRTAFKKVYQIMKNEADAEDVIQEAWMKAFIHLNKFDGRAKFSTWLARIAINSALMALRRRRSRPEAPIEFTDGENWQMGNCGPDKGRRRAVRNTRECRAFTRSNPRSKSTIASCGRDSTIERSESNRGRRTRRHLYFGN